MLRNLEIWSEILRHFTIHEGHEASEEVVVKRRTLLSVALLSRTLTDLAVNSLWRSMASLEPICRVINSDNSGDTLGFQRDDLREGWVGTL